MTDLCFNDLLPLAEQIISDFSRLGWTLSTAESCTGGLVSAALTAVAGSSAVLDRGFVTYSNHAKHEMLGVSHHLLQNFGAVSQPVAEAMALGAQKHANTHAALSITGIAGPGGGSADKPVGLVHFAWIGPNGRLSSQAHVFSGDRTQVRLQAAQCALRGVLRLHPQA